MAQEDEALDWEGQLRSDGWMFEEYRRRNWLLQRIDRENISAFRELWLRRTLPRGGRPVGFPRREHVPLRALGPPERRRKRVLRPADGQRRDSTGVKIVRLLGWGGNGLVALANYRTAPRQPALTFVIKASLFLWDSQELYREGLMTEKFQRAAHTVQLIPRTRIGLPPQTPYPTSIRREDDSSATEDSSGDDSYDDDKPSDKYLKNMRKTRRQQIEEDRPAYISKMEKFDTWLNELHSLERERVENYFAFSPPARLGLGRKDFLLLEHIDNGTLYNLLCSRRENSTRGGVNRHQNSNRGGDPIDIGTSGKRISNELFEQAPVARKRWRAKRTVHFDIDPTNILIAGLDPGAKDDEHKQVPRLKLSDFGIAEDIKPNKRNEYYHSLRRSAKWGYFAPEQFGFDWDYVRQRDGSLIEEDGPEISEQPIAGNYGAHTNVWGIALTMWQLITKCWPELPPQYQPGTPRLRAHYCNRILTEEEFSGVDFELREIVAQCMAHNPADRPGPRMLVNRALAGIRKRFPNNPRETDDFIEDWVQSNIFDARGGRRRR
ncbi:hypothetical protein O1611_g5114 [Lasiodiplodia mahajangana]|uniref:Uncharacterized protein n=1 Tax=Lasiodiplodia mahajangana TaxID=1108764 RepID=A0ACC2JMD2_9PEZI|nr:hypothetical protein O1611_g5114 [Lasiodiplodia mahajangana]